MSKPVLPDVLEPGLRIVFCGTQAGAVSARRGAYYAGPGNKFWKVLHEVGLTTERLLPDAFGSLPLFGIGLTDVAKRTFGADTTLRGTYFDREGFLALIAANTPMIVAFNGKRAAQAVLSRPSAELRYGAQSERLGNTAVFVLPSTSGAAAGYWSIEPWRELAAHAAGTGIR